MTLRPNELGILTLGTHPDPLGILIPPFVNTFKINSYCHSSCLEYVN